jgi:hypothetical protein
MPNIKKASYLAKITKPAMANKNSESGGLKWQK